MAATNSASTSALVQLLEGHFKKAMILQTAFGDQHVILRDASSLGVRVSRRTDVDGAAKPKQALSSTESNATTFLELAEERFEMRAGRPATADEKDWNFLELQLVRVPKAGSSEASAIARRLGGCKPKGPCCNYPGNPMGSCPEVGLMCYTVTGCVGHKMDLTRHRMLRDPSIFSMSNLRDVVDRMVSGFFYDAPHSPPCAQQDAMDVAECFTSMTQNSRYLNVASRMFSGHNSYEGRTHVCMTRESARCTKTLATVLEGACHLNYITMTEAWGSSVLLLFETLPFLGPSADYFPQAKAGGSRQNTGQRHEEGMQHITPQLRALAGRANEVDVVLHDFVTAKFCKRLQDLDLMTHPLVMEELKTYQMFHRRCTSDSWALDTLASLDHITPPECRLFEPLPRPIDSLPS